MRRRTFLTSAVVLPPLWNTACSSSAKSTEAATPRRLRFAYNPSTDDVETSLKRYRRLQQYLEKELAMPVELTQASGYSSTIEAMRARKVDCATMGPMSYLIAAQRAGAEAIVLPGTTSKGPGTYQSCIIVRGDSPVKSLEELLAHGKKVTFAFVDPASTSGHLIPRAFLESKGIDPETAFRKVHFSNSHLTTLYTVLGGKVDAAATMPSMIEALIARGKLKRGDVRLLWQSPPIPQSPVVMRKDLPAGFKERVRKAFLDLADKDPDLARAMQATTTHSDFRYFPATDSMYDGLREIARNVKNTRMLE